MQLSSLVLEILILKILEKNINYFTLLYYYLLNSVFLSIFLYSSPSTSCITYFVLFKIFTSSKSKYLKIIRVASRQMSSTSLLKITHRICGSFFESNIFSMEQATKILTVNTFFSINVNKE